MLCVTVAIPRSSAAFVNTSSARSRQRAAPSSSFTGKWMTPLLLRQPPTACDVPASSADLAGEFVDVQQVSGILVLAENVQARGEPPHMLVVAHFGGTMRAGDEVGPFGHEPAECLVAGTEGQLPDRLDRRQVRRTPAFPQKVGARQAGGAQVPVEEPVGRAGTVFGWLVHLDDVRRVDVQQVVDAVAARAFLVHQVRADQCVELVGHVFRGAAGHGAHRVDAEPGARVEAEQAEQLPWGRVQCVVAQRDRGAERGGVVVMPAGVQETPGMSELVRQLADRDGWAHRHVLAHDSQCQRQALAQFDQRGECGRVGRCSGADAFRE